MSELGEGLLYNIEHITFDVIQGEWWSLTGQTAAALIIDKFMITPEKLSIHNSR